MLLLLLLFVLVLLLFTLFALLLLVILVVLLRVMDAPFQLSTSETGTTKSPSDSGYCSAQLAKPRITTFTFYSVTCNRRSS